MLENRERRQKWNALPFEALAMVARYATTDLNTSAFLLHVAQALYNVKITPLKKNPATHCADGYKVRYRWGRPYLRYTPHKCRLSLLELRDLLESLAWLLNHERTKVEPMRTRAPLECLCGRYYPPAEGLTDLTLGEYLLAEDLLLPLRGQLLDASCDECETFTQTHLIPFLATVYAPRRKDGARIALAERNPEAIAQHLQRSKIKRGYKSTLILRLFVAWWYANLALLEEVFPVFFERTPHATPEEEDPPTRGRLAASLPSNLLYLLCDGDFSKLDTVRNTNLWDALRLLQNILNRQT